MSSSNTKRPHGSSRKTTPSSKNFLVVKHKLSSTKPINSFYEKVIDKEGSSQMSLLKNLPPPAEWKYPEVSAPLNRFENIQLPTEYKTVDKTIYIDSQATPSPKWVQKSSKKHVSSKIRHCKPTTAAPAAALPAVEKSKNYTRLITSYLSQTPVSKPTSSPKLQVVQAANPVKLVKKHVSKSRPVQVTPQQVKPIHQMKVVAKPAQVKAVAKPVQAKAVVKPVQVKAIAKPKQVQQVQQVKKQSKSPKDVILANTPQVVYTVKNIGGRKALYKVVYNQTTEAVETPSKPVIYIQLLQQLNGLNLKNINEIPANCNYCLKANYSANNNNNNISKQLQLVPYKK